MAAQSSAQKIIEREERTERLLPSHVETSGSASVTSKEVKQAYQVLRVGFTVAPIVAGLDKFSYLLTDWNQYLSPAIPRLVGMDDRQFMKVVGAIEVAAGAGVAIKPKIFGYVVSAWLAGIIVNLLMRRRYYDIALRDLGLGLGAFSLARMAQGMDQARRA